MQAVVDQRRTSGGVARDGERDEVGHGSARHQQAARIRWIREDALEPLEHLRFDIRGRFLSAPDVDVHPASQHVRQHACG